MEADLSMPVHQCAREPDTRDYNCNNAQMLNRAMNLTTKLDVCEREASSMASLSLRPDDHQVAEMKAKPEKSFYPCP